MAKLNAAARNALPSSDFALPKERKYPINDASHQAKAKGRAVEMEHKGVISSSTEKKIVSAANRRMHGDGAKGSHWSNH